MVLRTMGGFKVLQGVGVFVCGVCGRVGTCMRALSVCVMSW